MNKKHIETSLKGAVEQTTPDVLNNILSLCGNKNGKVMKMKKSNKKLVMGIIGLAAAFAIVIGGFFIFKDRDDKVHTTVTFDVNPSIEMSVDKDENVLEVKALNDDAKKIIDGLNFKNSSLDDAVNTLINAMVKQGYINEYSNSILISVDSKSETDGKVLEQKLNRDVESILTNDSFKGSVISQTVKHSEELDKAAQKYGITIGKAQLIKAIVEANERYTFEQLVPLTINELNLISRSGEMLSEEINVTGTASDKSFITPEEAKLAALNYSGISVEEYSNNAWYCFHSYEDDGLFYEVSLYYNNFEYKYNVHAKSGEILKAERIEDTDTLNNTSVTFKKEIFEHFGLTYDQLVERYGKEINRDWHKGALHCEFENGVGRYAVTWDYDEATREFFITGTDTCFALDLDAKYVFDNFDEKIAITDLAQSLDLEITTSFDEMKGEGYFSTFKYNEYTVMFNTIDKRFIEEDTKICIVIK